MNQTLLPIVSRCPNGPQPIQHFTEAALRAAIGTGTLRFHCGECGASWTPGDREQRDIIVLLDEYLRR
jgi:hypothetical protein